MNEINTSYDVNRIYNNYENQTMPTGFGGFDIGRTNKANEIEQGIVSILSGIGHLIKAFMESPTKTETAPSADGGILDKVGDFTKVFGSFSDLFGLAKDIFTNPLNLIGKVTKLFK